MESYLGPVLALVSAVAFGAADFAGGVLSKGRSSIIVVGVSQACSLVVLLTLALWVPLPADHGWVPWSMLAAAAGASGMVLFYKALAIGTVGVVSPIAALGAAVPVVAGLLAGERPELVALVGMVLALAGAGLASGPEFRDSSPHKAQAVTLAVAVAVLFGFALLAMAKGSQTSAFATMLGMRTTSVCGFAVAWTLTRKPLGVRARDLPALAALGLGDVGANFLFGLATTFGMLSLTTGLNAVYPVVTVALAAVVLHERLTRIQFLGAAAALAGVVMMSIS